MQAASYYSYNFHRKKFLSKPFLFHKPGSKTSRRCYKLYSYSIDDYIFMKETFLVKFTKTSIPQKFWTSQLRGSDICHTSGTNKLIKTSIVTGFWKTVPNHTFLFITATQRILYIRRYFIILHGIQYSNY